MYPIILDEIPRVLLGHCSVVASLGRLFGDSVVHRRILENMAGDPMEVDQETFDELGVGSLGAYFRDGRFDDVTDSPCGYKDFYKKAIQLILDIGSDPKRLSTDEGLASSVNLWAGLINDLPTLWSTILWVEDVWIQILRGSIRDREAFGARSPFASFPIESIGERKTLFSTSPELFEHHAFMLYSAAFESDVAKLVPEFKIPQPSDFVARKDASFSRWPMWRFWDWLAVRLSPKEHRMSWFQLAGLCEALGDDKSEWLVTEVRIAKWANTKVMKRTEKKGQNETSPITWRDLNRCIERIKRNKPDLPEHFALETQISYGIARILHENAIRCLDTVSDFCEVRGEELEDFSTSRIKACKENECRFAPPAPAFPE